VGNSFHTAQEGVAVDLVALAVVADTTLGPYLSGGCSRTASEAEGLQQLVDTFKDLTSRPPESHCVPTTNFFAVKLLKQPIYSYVVDITPHPVSNRLKTRIFQLLEQNPTIVQHIAYIAHDRCQTLVSARKLPQPLNVIVSFQPGQDFAISIMLDREFDPNEMTRCVL